MPRRLFSRLSDRGDKKNIVSIFLVTNAFVWYFGVVASLEYYLKSYMGAETLSPVAWTVHFSAVILSALAGASFGKHLERSKFLTIWMIIGIVSSTTLFVLSNSSPDILVILVSMFLGLSLGLGMPVCASYFSDSIAVENRGRISGVTFLASASGIIAFQLTVANLFLTGIILAVWRLSSLMIFLYAKDYRRMERNVSVPSFKEVFKQHSFVLYFVPWLMFSLLNYLANPSMPEITNNVDPRSIQICFMGAAAVLGGFLVDSIGRKRIAIAGFVLLGLGAAVLGFSNNPLLFYFNAILDGVAWGFFLVLFVLTLWGDLSYSFSSEKFYALGVMPFFLSSLLEHIVGKSDKISPAVFSFAAFLLFLAVLPLVYAPETLPEKIIKDNEMKTYLEKAQKIVQKAQKEGKKEQESEETELEFEVRQEELDKAQALAQECY